VLEVTSLKKSFGGFKAVNDASLSVKEGEVVAVIGPNGAGKTTLFNLITGVLKPDDGKVLFKGEDITGLPSYKVCRRGMSRSFQVVNVFPRLTVFENVQVSVLSQQKRTWNLFAPSAGLAVGETERILENVGLIDIRDATSAALSHGERKVLEIAIALGGNPQFLILDEPPRGCRLRRRHAASISSGSSRRSSASPFSSASTTWRSYSPYRIVSWSWCGGRRSSRVPATTSGAARRCRTRISAGATHA